MTYLHGLLDTFLRIQFILKLFELRHAVPRASKCLNIRNIEPAIAIKSLTLGFKSSGIGKSYEQRERLYTNCKHLPSLLA